MDRDTINCDDGSYIILNSAGEGGEGGLFTVSVSVAVEVMQAVQKERVVVQGSGSSSGDGREQCLRGSECQACNSREQ